MKISPVSSPVKTSIEVGPEQFVAALDGYELDIDVSWALASEGVWECDEGGACAGSSSDIGFNEWVVIDHANCLETQGEQAGVSDPDPRVILCAPCAVAAAFEIARGYS
jgi:hypothetical protein